MPRNLTAEQIADTLRATAPSLTFAAAYAVAKAMIGPAPKEFPATEADTKADDSVKKVTFEASA